MPIFEYGAIRIEIDDDGFMTEVDKWNDEVARALATSEGISEMTEAHWTIARYLREYYLKFNIAPSVRKLCKETGFSLKEIYALYPSGPAKGACRVAGLAHPTGCI